MPPRLLHTTALGLAVFYSVVGLTGESLHYLVQSLNSPVSNPPAADSEGELVVYFHSHGPDHHGHFHRHYAPRQAKGASQAETDAESSEHLRHGRRFHSEHACPLLTLTSVIKLSAGGGAVFAFDLDDIAAFEWPVDDLCSSVVHSGNSARGPPLLALNLT